MQTQLRWIAAGTLSLLCVVTGCDQVNKLINPPPPPPPPPVVEPPPPPPQPAPAPEPEPEPAAPAAPTPPPEPEKFTAENYPMERALAMNIRLKEYAAWWGVPGISGEAEPESESGSKPKSKSKKKGSKKTGGGGLEFGVRFSFHPSPEVPPTREYKVQLTDARINRAEFVFDGTNEDPEIEWKQVVPGATPKNAPFHIDVSYRNHPQQPWIKLFAGEMKAQ